VKRTCEEVFAKRNSCPLARVGALLASHRQNKILLQTSEARLPPKGEYVKGYSDRSGVMRYRIFPYFPRRTLPQQTALEFQHFGPAYLVAALPYGLYFAWF
jgi:hypothetical protein